MRVAVTGLGGGLAVGARRRGLLAVRTRLLAVRSGLLRLLSVGPWLVVAHPASPNEVAYTFHTSWRKPMAPGAAGPLITGFMTGLLRP